MKLVVYSNSSPFERHLKGQLDIDFTVSSSLRAPAKEPRQLYLLHLSSMKLAGFEWMSTHSAGKSIALAVCSDVPAIGEMLECVRLGARAYCNSHMAAEHYRQLLRMVSEGQSWFPPKMLAETFKLAGNAIQPDIPDQHIESLTDREREIALTVSEGKTNRQVAEICSISEVTVKTHMTNIYKKLGVRDRVSLALLLKQS